MVGSVPKLGWKVSSLELTFSSIIVKFGLGAIFTISPGFFVIDSISTVTKVPTHLIITCISSIINLTNDEEIGNVFMTGRGL